MELSDCLTKLLSSILIKVADHDTTLYKQETRQKNDTMLKHNVIHIPY